MSENDGNKRDNPFSAYVIASQVGFMVIAPLLLFIWGGSWLVNRFELPQWVMIIFIVLGIVVMLSSVGTYLAKIIKMYGNDKKDPNIKLKHDVRDHDYYDNN